MCVRFFFFFPAEINRVRKDMYNDTVSGLVDKHPLELPEAHGPIVHLQEKLFVPVKEYPDVSKPTHTLAQNARTHTFLQSLILLCLATEGCLNSRCVEKEITLFCKPAT